MAPGSTSCIDQEAVLKHFGQYNTHTVTVYVIHCQEECGQYFNLVDCRNLFSPKLVMDHCGVNSYIDDPYQTANLVPSASSYGFY